MKLSVKSDYAARAVLGLARQYHAGGAIKVEQLAEQQGVPANYLVQILIELKAKQIVKSLRGKAGGYMLARPPGEITLGEIIRCIHGRVFDTPALGDRPGAPELARAWRRLQEAVDQAADAINFQQLWEESQSKERMYYI